MISCADVFYEKEDYIEEESIVGYWFACEFGYSKPDCIIFDDDRLQFTNDGKVYSSKNSLKCLAMIVIGVLVLIIP